MMRKILPVNGYYVVTLLAEEEDQCSVAFGPETLDNLYNTATVRVIKRPDCPKIKHFGDLAIVERHLLRKIVVDDDEEIWLVPESAIILFFDEELKSGEY